MTKIAIICLIITVVSCVIWKVTGGAKYHIEMKIAEKAYKECNGSRVKKGLKYYLNNITDLLFALASMGLTLSLVVMLIQWLWEKLFL